MKLKAPQMITPGRMWKPPKDQPFEPKGIALGSWVEIAFRDTPGQVWAQGNGRYWWVADGTTYHYLHQDALRLVAQANEVQEEIAV